MLTNIQEIYVSHLENHLLYPIQCIINGTRINELPKVLDDNPDEATNKLQVTDPLDNEFNLKITFCTCGITTYFPVRKPTV